MKKIKRISSILLGGSLVLLGLKINIPKINAEVEFESGSGTKDNPYIIKTGEQLQIINNYCGEKYKNTYFSIDESLKTLDMKDISFEPLCELKDGQDADSLTNAFYGHFNGNNVELTNLKIETKNIAGGLFSATNGAEISNIGIDANSSIITTGKTNITKISPTGAIVGEASNTTISNVWNKGSISAEASNVGGIVGRLINNSKIKKAYNTGKITSGIDDYNNNFIGGITGYGIDSSITDSYNTSSIEAEGISVGGIIGELTGKSEITNTYNTGNISSGKDEYGYSIIGGIVGRTNKENDSLKIKISKVYNTGNISATGSRVGGIIGENSNELEMNDVYNTGIVAAGSDIDNNSLAGGIIGVAYNKINIQNIANYTEAIKGDGQSLGLLIGEIGKEESSIKNAYYLKETTELNSWTKAKEDLTSENVKGYSKEELKKQDSYIGFDFNKIWTIDNDYAVFINEEKNSEDSSVSENKDKNNLPSVTIKYDGKIIDIENFLYGDGRTFVDLATFCKKTDICSAKLVKETYEITKNKKLTDTSNGEYTYLVEHKANTKVFTSSIIIGGRKIVDDENTQTSTDVTSCPTDVKGYECTNQKLYVPIRFLTQALGLRVEWDGETSTVNITDTFEDAFFKKYEVNITEGECKDNIDSCKILKTTSNNEYEIDRDKTYYIMVYDKETKKIKSYSKYFSFYETVNQEGNKEPYTYTVNPFQISSNTLKMSNENTNTNDSSNVNIAQIIIYKIESSDEDYKEENCNTGSYPFVINSKFKLKSSNTKTNAISSDNNEKLTVILNPKNSNSITVQLILKNSQEDSMCELYQSDKEDGEYNLVGNLNCSEKNSVITTLNNLQEDTTYYFKGSIDGGKTFSKVVNITTSKK